MEGNLFSNPKLLNFPKVVDLGIISTNSRDRRNAIEVLLSECCPKWLILEKFLFPCVADYLVVDKILRERGVKSWVNCVRRTYPRFDQVKEFISVGSPIRYEVSGKGWQMASNLIHHLDEFAGLCDCFDLEVSSEALSWPPEQNKRPGYWEFHGKVFAATKRGDLFVARCESGDAPSGILGDRLIEISSGDRKATILQSKPEMTWQIGEQIQVEPYPMPFQSETTWSLLEDLCETGNCALPTYTEAMQLHLAVLREFQRHAEECSKSVHSYIPIT